MVMKAKNIIANAHFGTQLNVWFSAISAYQKKKEIQMFTNKWDQLLIAFSLYISNSRTKGLVSSIQ